MEVFVRRSAGAIVSCWITLDATGFAAPGCIPDERTTDVIARRNSYRHAAQPTAPPRPQITGNALIRCTCGRITRAATSNIRDLSAPPVMSDPPDPAVPYGSTTCWLSVGDEDGPDAGCQPDARTTDVLARRRRKPEPPVPVAGPVAVTAPPIAAPASPPAPAPVLEPEAIVTPMEAKGPDPNTPARATRSERPRVHAAAAPRDDAPLTLFG